MVSSDKVTILLADEDALRREGLTAVLKGTSQFEIVAQCPDGEAAMDQIRKLRPDVAVVDLNIPVLHGIELVRRVRGEALGTKIVILSGTADDEIIREVVRAGGDAYLLKNGPARHLIDAISYVRDGGQYFSPQLRRDGLDRHLLEEAPRVLPDHLSPPEIQSRNEKADADTDGAPPHREVRASRQRRAASKGTARRTSDPQRLRERLREEAASGDLDERDYDILTMMADGIRPILDRLDDIEGRIVDMEAGDAPVPSNVRGWLDNQMVDTFRDSRGGTREVALGRTVGDLEARLPRMIEDAVSTRFQSMAATLQGEIEEAHLRTLESFVKNIQVKLVQRVSALETDMSKQAEAMNQLREYSQRTEDNLSRLISGVDKLAQELPKRLQAPAVEASPQLGAHAKPTRHTSSRSLRPMWMWIGIIILVGAGFGVVRLIPKPPGAGLSSLSGSTAPAAGTPAPPKLEAPPANAGTKTKMDAARQYADGKDYATAEDIYRQVLRAEPGNVDAMKALASVLYREDKLEESAAILDKLPRN